MVNNTFSHHILFGKCVSCLSVFIYHKVTKQGTCRTSMPNWKNISLALSFFFFPLLKKHVYIFLTFTNIFFSIKVQGIHNFKKMIFMLVHKVTLKMSTYILIYGSTYCLQFYTVMWNGISIIAYNLHINYKIFVDCVINNFLPSLTTNATFSGLTAALTSSTSTVKWVSLPT